jgi:hypothetical protein
MFFSADFLNLIFYCAQQLGITLGVGAETIMLAAYLISMRDGVVDEKETQYARAIKRVMAAALWLIVVSGLGITALHLTAGESVTVFTSAFLFKWMLIVLAIALTLLRRVSKLSVVEGVVGGTWYALFLVHILAPDTTWFNLGTLYAVWLVGFVLCWEALVVLRREKKSTPIKKPAPPPPARPVQAVPVPVLTPAPVKVAPPPPVIAPVAPIVSTVPAPVPPPPPPPPMPEPIALPKDFIPPKEARITLGPSVPLPTNPASPGIKVTDTPFLPKVPALQPIPATSGSELASLPATPTMPVPSPEPKSVITTLPGGTSAMALNVMPKNPTELEVKK